MALPNPGMDFTAFDTLPAASLDDMVENIEALADGSGLNTGDASNGVANAKLKTGAGEPGGAWDSWTPTLTNLSGGTLTYAKYKVVGKTVHFALKYVLAGAGVSGSPEFTPPVTMATRYTNNRDMVDGVVQLYDANGNRYPGYMALGNPGTIVVFGAGAGSSAYIAIGASNPFTWASGDSISVAGTYEAA